MRPTSSYLCSQCKTQLFTNLDIQIHEPAVVADKDTKKEGRSKSRDKKAKRNGTVKLNTVEPVDDTNSSAQDYDIATIIDFNKGSKSAKH